MDEFYDPNEDDFFFDRNRDAFVHIFDFYRTARLYVPKVPMYNVFHLLRLVLCTIFRNQTAQGFRLCRQLELVSTSYRINKSTVKFCSIVFSLLRIFLLNSFKRSWSFLG